MVVLAADMRASMGNIAYEEESEKIYRITDKMAMTNAGNVGDSLTIIRFLRSQAKLYELERGELMTPKGASTLLSNVLNNTRFYPFLVQFYSENLGMEDAIKLGVRAIEAGKRRDIYSGGKSVTVFVVDKQGVREIPQPQVLKYIQEVNEPVAARKSNA